jgi:ParB family transcriptional regulator, chromosome partitioning protein
VQSLLYLDPRQLEPDDENVRRDPGDLAPLAESLRRYGVLQPLGVTAAAGWPGSGQAARYRVVYGNRRREAAILAGLEAVPCVSVPSAQSTDHLVTQLLENMQRRDLNDIEKAEGLARLRRQLASELGPGVKAEALDSRVSEMVGLAPRTVRRYLALRDLPPAVRDLLADGRLTVTQAQHLAQLPSPAMQEQVAARAADEDWTAAQISRVCAALARAPGMDVEQAAETAMGGWTAVERLGPPPAAVPAAEAAVAAEAPRRLPRSAQPQAESDDDSDLWAEDATGAPTPEASGEPDVFAQSAGPRKSETADGHRVFRIRTLAAFCDEVDRIARCVQDGDLARAAKGDDTAAMRLELAARQLAFALREVEALATLSRS